MAETSVPADVWAEFEADLERQVASWADALRERLEEIGPPTKPAN